MTLDGWLTARKTKKEIARDKKKATETMKRKNSRGGGTKKKGAPKSSRGRKSAYEEDSDFSADDDSFIVDDDGDVEIEESEDEAFDVGLEDEEEDEDDHELVLHDDEDSEDGNDHETETIKPAFASSRSGRAASRNPPNGKKPNGRSIAVNLDSDDSDDSDLESYLPTGNLRKSAPSKLLQEKTEAAKNRFNPSLDASVMNADKKKRKNKFADYASSSSLARLQKPALKKFKANPKVNSSIVAQRDNPENDDEEELTSPGYTPNKSSKFRGKSTRPTRPNSEIQYEEIFSSDEENTVNYSTASSKKVKAPPSAEKSKYFEGLHQKPRSSKSQNTIVLDDSESSDDEALKNLPPSKKKPNNRNVLEDTPEPSEQGRRRKLNKTVSKLNGSAKTYSINDSSDEDDEVVRVGNNPVVDDGFDDEDTRVAMRLSLKESKKQKATSSKKSTKASGTESSSSNNNNNIETILDDSSDEEDGDQGEEYYDEEKETASNVLRSAEQLSDHVVRAMSRWFRKDDNNQNGGAGGGVVQGIIIDGAVSLGAIDESKSGEESSDGTHKWICKTEMEKAIPNVKLSGYQLIGVNWMALLNGMTCEVGTKGTKNVNGVLADEMGLGKTVQTIAFLAYLKYRREKQAKNSSSPLPHLIVVPVSTLPNWMREFEKFCPEMSVVKYHGSQQEREGTKELLREHLPKYSNEYVMKQTTLDVIVAPVSYFQKENSPDRKFLSNFKYDYLVVDEAHNLKNAKSTRYKMLDKVKTEHRLLLTGTPVQNNPQELLNMLSFIMPLFSKAGSPFEDTDNYTEQMLKHFVDEKAEQGDEETAYKKLKKLFAPFVLRRRKDDVIAQMLPKKERKTIFVDLSESTRSIYKSIIRAHVNKDGNTISPATGEHLFTNLRKCAHHPLLLRTRWNTPAEKERLIDKFIRYGAFKGDECTNLRRRVAEEMESWNDFEVHLTALDLIERNKHRREDLQQYVLSEQDLFSSAKFESLRDLLPGLIEEDHRILIFSSWTSCLDLLGCLLQHLDIKFQRMDGSCPADERQRLIDAFNTDMSLKVFLLSTKACGLGINLTSADTCIIHDLDFNPFNDLQAEDRCHRIGQKKPVTAYKLIARDSVDEDIYKMQEKKAKMNAAIMDSSSSRKEKSAILKGVLEKAEQKQEELLI